MAQSLGSERERALEGSLTILYNLILEASDHHGCWPHISGCRWEGQGVDTRRRGQRATWSLAAFLASSAHHAPAASRPQTVSRTFFPCVRSVEERVLSSVVHPGELILSYCLPSN